jgi:phage terminase small subunit
MANLTPKQEKFCIEYLKSGNASAAYRLSYNAKKMSEQVINNEAKKLIDNHKIAVRLDELRKPVVQKTQLTLERVIIENMNVAFFDIRTILDDDGAVKPVNEWPAAAGAAIASVEVLEQYEGSGKERVFVGYLKKIKLVDKGGALDRLMKHLGGYEQDNKQKSNAMQEFYNMISGNSLPVVHDVKGANLIEQGREQVIEAQIIETNPVNIASLKPVKSKPAKKLNLGRD